MKNDNTQQTIKKTKTKENRRKGDIYEIKKKYTKYVQWRRKNVEHMG